MSALKGSDLAVEVGVQFINLLLSSAPPPRGATRCSTAASSLCPSQADQGPYGPSQSGRCGFGWLASVHLPRCFRSGWRSPAISWEWASAAAAKCWAMRCAQVCIVMMKCHPPLGPDQCIQHVLWRRDEAGAGTVPSTCQIRLVPVW